MHSKLAGQVSLHEMISSVISGASSTKRFPIASSIRRKSSIASSDGVPPPQKILHAAFGPSNAAISRHNASTNADGTALGVVQRRKSQYGHRVRQNGMCT